MAEIWMFSSAKGGVGKSFIASNLAIGLAKVRKKVLLLDLDIQSANLHTLFGLNYFGPSINHYLDENKPLTEIIRKSPFSDCDFIQGFQQISADVFSDFKKTTQLITDLRRLSYDYIFIDTMTGLTESHLNFSNLVDKVFVVSTPEMTSIEKMHRWFDLAVEKKFETEQINILMNFCRTAQHSTSGFNLNSVLAKKYGINCSIIGHFPFDNAAWQSSMANQNLFKTFPSSTFCHEIYRFSKQFIDSEQLRAVS